MRGKRHWIEVITRGIPIHVCVVCVLCCACTECSMSYQYISHELVNVYVTLEFLMILYQLALVVKYWHCSNRHLYHKIRYEYDNTV